MSDQSPPDGGNGTPPASPPGAGNPPGSDGPRIDYKEIVGLRKETRELVDTFKAFLASEQERRAQKAAAKAGGTIPPPPASTPPANGAAPSDEVQALRAEIAFKDALADAGVTDSKKKSALTRLWATEKPADVGSWLTQTMEDLGISSANARPSAPPVTDKPVLTPSNAGGAPVRGDVMAGVPKSIFEMPDSEIQKLSPQQIHELVRQSTQGSTKPNPYSNIRRSHEKK